MTIHLDPSSTPGRNLTHVLTLSQWTAWLTVAPLNVELNDLVSFFQRMSVGARDECTEDSAAGTFLFEQELVVSFQVWLQYVICRVIAFNLYCSLPLKKFVKVQ